MKIIWLICFFLIFTSLLGFYLAIRPIKIYSNIDPSTFNIPYEEITLITQDNIKLSAWYIPSKKPTKKAIILLHGYPADKGDILPSRLFLHDDFNLLFLDFRYFGKSQGYYSTVGALEVMDVQAAVKFLQERQMGQIGIWGFSLGGAVAIMTAAVTPAIKAIVAESSYANLYDMVFGYYRIPILRYPLGELTRLWGVLFLKINIKTISPAEALKKLHIPVLIIHSKKDEVIAFSQALKLQEIAKQQPNVQIEFVDDRIHGQPMENYEKIISEFFRKNLKE